MFWLLEYPALCKNSRSQRITSTGQFVLQPNYVGPELHNNQSRLTPTIVYVAKIVCNKESSTQFGRENNL